MLTKEAIEDRGTEAMNRYSALGRTETVTLNHKATASSAATPVTITDCSVESFDPSEIDAVEVLRTDRRFRFAVGAIAVTPTIWSTLTRADGTVWQVVAPKGGPGTPFWILQGRQRG